MGARLGGAGDVQEFIDRHDLDGDAAGELWALLRALVAESPPTGSQLEGSDSRPRFRTIDSDSTLEDEVSVRRDSDPSERYEDRGRVGTGGMAEVRRVWDPELRRTTAMKVLWEDHGGEEAGIARFVREARTTAGLEHPGVVPVHEIGRLADGRWYFTMKEVRGRTLAEVIHDVHRRSGDGAWGADDDGWTLRRLVETFRKVCETVAYAHDRGVIHRDIKPRNIMVGEYGEALVLDWGLAKSLTDAEPLDPDILLEEIVARAGDDLLDTPPGWVVGTPAYMPPELAGSSAVTLSPTIDVYSLGALLYEVLSGRPPYRGRDGREVLKKLTTAPPPPVDEAGPADEGAEAQAGEERSSAPPPIPPELKRICAKAMHRAPEDRYPDARALCEAVIGWLEGVQRRERALSYTTRADSLRPEIRRVRNQSAILTSEAERLLADLPPGAGPNRKRAAWALEDTAESLSRDADLQEVELLRLAQSALTHHPGLPEAHALLADHYRERHEEALAARDTVAAARFEAQLGIHDTGRHAEWLAGDGRISLTTRPPGARVELLRWVSRERILRPEPMRSLGTTPLRAVPLSAGSYLLRLSHPGRVTVDLPVLVERCTHSTRTPPRGHVAGPVVLPLEAEFDPQDVYIPAGWFESGGDPDAPGVQEAARTWVDAFLVKRFPVTNVEYLEFLNDLVARDEAADADRYAPRHRAARRGERGRPVYEFDGDYRLGVDSDGDEWLPEWPVVFVDHPSALAYAAWWAERKGEAWRLPTEEEWEKAARGVDGRFHPWGDRFDPTFCRMRRTLQGGHGMIARVGTHPTDTSPWGVQDMAGNVGEWCAASGPDDDRKLRIRRGGSWTFSPRGCRSAARWSESAHFRAADLGFRLARSVDP